MSFTRRNVLGGLGGLAIGPALMSTVGPRAFAADLHKVSVQFGWLANVEYSGIFTGLEKGYFEDQGVDLAYTAGGPNAPDPLVVVAAGKADFGFTSWLPLIDAINKGNDFVIVGTELQQSPLGILSLAKNPIKAPKDIVGKKILAQGPNEKTAIDAVLGLAGLPKTWTMVTTGFSPEPLLAGDGDGYTAFGTNQPITLEKMGLKRDKDYFFASFDQLGLKRYDDIIFCSRAYLEAHRPQVVGFLRGFIKGIKDNAKDPKVAAELVINKYGADYGLDLAQQIRENELMGPMYYPLDDDKHPLLTLNRAFMTGPMVEGAKASGRTDIPDIDKIADFSVAEEAHKGI
jgi:ABC-type nitrate/sulfonate/bicarbonate transport system substrate-binding protein